MSGLGATPLIVDTGAFYARYDERASRHKKVNLVFDAIASGTTPLRPLYTTTHVLVELGTLLMRMRTHDIAVRGLDRIRKSPAFTVIRPTDEEFDRAYQQFVQYDDQQITLVDHLTAVLANKRNIAHVFAFDDDFRTLGLTLVPEDIDLG